MTKEEALKLIQQYLKRVTMVWHSLQVEVVMRALAERFNENKEEWGLIGLLHDLDADLIDYKNEPKKHTVLTEEILIKQKVNPKIIEAIKAHNEATGKERVTLSEKTIYCADALVGLIVAATLVLPSKKIADLTSQSVLNRFKEKSFARGAKREIIASCSEIGLTLEEFIQIGLRAMRNIANEIGL
jgi:putative nucleotidyltransferase with HDIG domain